MVEEWGVSKATGQDAETGRPLAEGEVYYAVLFETPDGFERKDYSEASWTGPPEGAFCYWKSRVPIRETKTEPLVVDVALLMELFLRLEDETTEIKQQLRFVLALLLMRKKQLRFDGAVREDGREYWRMLRVADKSEHKVLNPRLDEPTVERLSHQLTAILSGDVEAIELPFPSQEHASDAAAPSGDQTADEASASSPDGAQNAGAESGDAAGRTVR